MVFNMCRKIYCLSAALLILMTAGGCKKESGESQLSEPQTSAADQVTDTVEEEKTEGVTDTPAGINPLTGESGYNEAANGKRPVAIMVNNLTGALPQYGIEQADVIYELPVEGGITRLMAVYADYTSVPDVCSVRSCRYYYPLICLGMDAIYCHWGEDMTIALETLNRTGIDHLDGGYEKKMFYRDPERVGVYASEHTGYLKGAELPDVIAEKGFRTDIGEQYSGEMFDFTESPEAPSGMTASAVTLRFSSAYYSTFIYNPDTGEYLKQHSGKPHMDGRTGNQLGFDNVFVLQTDIHTRADGYLMDVALDGGTGYYFSQGGGTQITWKKEGETAPIKVYGADGNELAVNVGESYIGIIGTDKAVTVE